MLAFNSPPRKYGERPTLHFTSALRAQLSKPNTPRKAPDETKPCSWRLVEIVVSGPVVGEVPPNGTPASL